MRILNSPKIVPWNTLLSIVCFKVSSWFIVSSTFISTNGTRSPSSLLSSPRWQIRLPPLLHWQLLDHIHANHSFYLHPFALRFTNTSTIMSQYIFFYTFIWRNRSITNHSHYLYLPSRLPTMIMQLDKVLGEASFNSLILFRPRKEFNFAPPPIIVLPIVLDASRTLFTWIQVVLCFLQNHPIVPPSFGGTVGWFFSGFFMWTGGFWISGFRSGGIGLLWYELPSPLSLIGSRVGMRLLWRNRVFDIGRSTTTWTTVVVVFVSISHATSPTIPNPSLSPNSQY